jgi:hypothetical protein
MMVDQPAGILLKYRCGNLERFLEIMEYESHIVNGQGTYLHVVDAVVQEYRCCQCSRVVRPMIENQRGVSRGIEALGQSGEIATQFTRPLRQRLGTAQRGHDR